MTAWIFLANKVVSRLKTVSMCWRIGFPRNSSHAGIGRLEFFSWWVALMRPKTDDVAAV